MLSRVLGLPGISRNYVMVPRAGIEPARLAAGDFESPASTNFTTWANLRRACDCARRKRKLLPKSSMRASVRCRDGRAAWPVGARARIDERAVFHDAHDADSLIEPDAIGGARVDDTVGHDEPVRVLERRAVPCGTPERPAARLSACAGPGGVDSSTPTVRSVRAARSSSGARHSS